MTSSILGIYVTPSSSSINNNYKEEDSNIETISNIIYSTAIAKPKV